MRVVLVAAEAAGLRVLQRLLAAGHDVAAVLAGGQAASGAAQIAALATRAGVPLWPGRLVNDPRLAEHVGTVDLLLNVHALHVIGRETLAVPTVGAFNLHPGPLPGHAGLNAPSWAIYHGATEHAVTLHWMEPEIDTGAIAYRADVPIAARDTGLTLSAKCVHHGLPLVDRLLADAPDGIPAYPQRGPGAYHGREAPHGGRLPWTLPGRRIADLVRAADYRPFRSPWGHPVTRLDDGRELAIVRAAPTGEPVDAPPGVVRDGAHVAAADEWVAVHELHVDGRPADPAAVLTAGARLG